MTAACVPQVSTAARGPKGSASAAGPFSLIASAQRHRPCGATRRTHAHARAPLCSCRCAMASSSACERSHRTRPWRASRRCASWRSCRWGREPRATRGTSLRHERTHDPQWASASAALGARAPAQRSPRPHRACARPPTARRACRARSLAEAAGAPEAAEAATAAATAHAGEAGERAGPARDARSGGAQSARERGGVRRRRRGARAWRAAHGRAWAARGGPM